MIESSFMEDLFGQAPQKRSEATKRILSTPEPTHEDRCIMVSQKHAPVEQYLPGLPSSDKANAFLHCRGASDLLDSACFATLVKGGRCSRPRNEKFEFLQAAQP